jgi:hypothetical protein
LKSINSIGSQQTRRPNRPAPRTSCNGDPGKPQRPTSRRKACALVRLAIAKQETTKAVQLQNTGANASASGLQNARFEFGDL